MVTFCKMIQEFCKVKKNIWGVSVGKPGQVNSSKNLKTDGVVSRMQIPMVISLVMKELINFLLIPGSKTLNLGCPGW